MTINPEFPKPNIEQITPNHKASGLPYNYTKFPGQWLTSASQEDLLYQ